MNLNTFRHQDLLLQTPWYYHNVAYHFLIGGYGCGKSFSGVLAILDIYHRYNGQQIVVGIGGTSQTLLRKTLLTELFRILEMGGIPYSHNKMEHIITIGSVQFIYIGTSNPEAIYAYNFSIFICDELDELPQDKAIAANTAIQERTRVTLPDGRQPFTIYMTTAQGLRGTYRIISEFKDNGTPFVKIRGLTKDNITLSPGYVSKLYALYTPNEALAFLEGHFVDLYTGRVYAEYREVDHLIQPFEVLPTDTIHIGQDLNSGFSKGAAVIVRGRTIFGIQEYKFPVIGNAPTIIRNDFPYNKIYWYPDSSAKEIMTGYIKEIRGADINLRMGTINPGIIDRIFIVNKLFKTGRLKVFKTLKEWPMALKTRQFDKEGNPEKGKTEKAPDHICDGAEYVIWRIVQSMIEFKDLYDVVKHGREAVDEAA